MGVAIFYILLAAIVLGGGLFFVFCFFFYQLQENLGIFLGHRNIRESIPRKKKNKTEVSVMGIPEKLSKYLKRHKVFYQVIVHPESFTSPDTAHAGHISGKALAKVVMVKAADHDVMTVLPSDRTVDLLKLSELLKTRDLRIEREKEFKDLFPEFEVGAMPPLKAFSPVPCYVDESLKQNKSICFNAGTHQHCIEVSAADFFRIINAKTGNFSVPGKKIREKVSAA